MYKAIYSGSKSISYFYCSITIWQGPTLHPFCVFSPSHILMSKDFRRNRFGGRLIQTAFAKGLCDFVLHRILLEKSGGYGLGRTPVRRGLEVRRLSRLQFRLIKYILVGG